MGQYRPATSIKRGEVEKRLSPRAECFARLVVTMPDMLNHMVTAVNISTDGIRFSGQRPLQTNDMVHIKLPVVGSRQARVIWSMGGHCGAQFVRAIEVDEYLPLMRALGVSSGTH